jgi:hypothetical protein
MKRFIWAFFYAISFSLSWGCLGALELVNEKDYHELDQIALETGTDKSSAYHNYTRVYSQYFAKFKDQPLKFLEIGIQYGNSVKLWERYFPNAELHFIDIDPTAIRYQSTRSHYHFINQTDWQGLVNFGIHVGGDFDIIIDDGGHRMDQVINSFHALFSFLKPGSFYIIEDLNTSYWSQYGSYGTPEKPKSGPGTAIALIKDLVDDLNYSGARTWCADINKVPPELAKALTIYQSEIEAIHFYRCLCIIIKRQR